MSSSAGSAQCRSSTTLTAGAWAARPLANRGHARPISSATDSGSRPCSGLSGSEMPAVIASAATVRSGSLVTCVTTVAQLLARRRGAVVEDDVGDRPQQLAQRPVREAVAVRHAAAGVHARLRDRDPGAAQELVDEARLAGAGLAEDRDHPRPPLLDDRPVYGLEHLPARARGRRTTRAGRPGRRAATAPRTRPPRARTGPRARSAGPSARPRARRRAARRAGRAGARASTSPSGSPARTSTSPVAIPARPPSASAARTARSASSSCARGMPNTATTVPPSAEATVPPERSISSRARCALSHSSAATVTSLRSSRGGPAGGAGSSSPAASSRSCISRTAAPGAVPSSSRRRTRSSS